VLSHLSRRDRRAWLVFFAVTVVGGGGVVAYMNFPDQGWRALLAFPGAALVGWALFKKAALLRSPADLFRKDSHHDDRTSGGAV
jgi:hypothetical protein